MKTEMFYSQHGEDFLMNEVFRNKKDGYFVEIGCLDGIEFSNTYYFERKGWKGLCVEANNDFIPQLTRNRPNSLVVHCAIGETNKDDVTFYANKLGSLSTLDKNEEERWKKNYKDYFHGFEEQIVSMRTLTSIFDQFHVDTIDFVSLDIEGYEVNALLGLDFDKYKPRIFIIEFKDAIHQNQLEEILFKYGYFYLSRIGCNLFYGRDLSDQQTVIAKYGKVQLMLVDQHGVEHLHEAIHLNPTFGRKVRSALNKAIRSLFKYLRK